MNEQDFCNLRCQTIYRKTTNPDKWKDYQRFNIFKRQKLRNTLTQIAKLQREIEKIEYSYEKKITPLNKRLDSLIDRLNNYEKIQYND